MLMNCSVPMLYSHNYVFTQGSLVFCVYKGVSQSDVIGHKAGYEKDILKRAYGVIKHLGYKIPYGRKLLSLETNLDHKINHDHCQLAVVITLLIASKQVMPSVAWQDTLFLGKVDLTGDVHSQRSILALLYNLSGKYKHIILPSCLSWLKAYFPNLPLLFFSNVGAVISWLTTKKITLTTIRPTKKKIPNYKFFDSIQGQVVAKRALLLSLAGKHPLLLAGSAGVGKSMLTEAVQCFDFINNDFCVQKKAWHNYWSTIPATTTQELSSKTTRPQLHGTTNRPYGVLAKAYFDVLNVSELADFSALQLNLLKGLFDYCSFSDDDLIQSQKHPVLLISTTNLCPCGAWGTNDPCYCSAYRRMLYLSKLQRPLLERFAIGLVLSKEASSATLPPVSGKEYAKLLQQSLANQAIRFMSSGKKCNQDLLIADFKILNLLTQSGWKLVQSLEVKLNLSLRGLAQLLRVALTIADFDRSAQIKKSHLLESVQYQLLPYKLHDQ